MRSRSSDRGATIVLFALSLVALMLVVALVVDYGFVRNTRQNSKGTSDAVVTAGAQALASDGTPRPWRGACEALSYLKANEPDRAFSISYFEGDGTTAVTNPCTANLTQVCLPNTMSSWAWIRAVDGEYTVDIRAGYDTPDPDFPEDTETYATDNGDPSRGSCDQMAVIISKQDAAIFGGIAGATRYDTAIRSVGRVAITQEGEAVPAFLILERTKCAALSQSVGASEGGIIVKRSSDGTAPGVIAVDSGGTDSGCNGNAEGNFTVYSGELGSGAAKRPGIVVEPALPDADGYVAPGVLSLYALQLGNTDHTYATPAGVSPAGTPGKFFSRQRVDDRYNPAPPDIPTITNLHATARALALATSPPAGYTEVTACNNQSDNNVLGAKIFVNCPGGYSPTAVTFAQATDIVFNGPVTVANNSSLFMPLAQNVTVGGTTAGGLRVAGGGRLGINGTSFADTDAGVVASCAAPDGPSSNITRLVVFGGGSSGNTEGGMNLAGRTALCKTAVYLAGPKSLTTYQRQATTDGTYDATCLPETPCPKDTGNAAQNAHFIISSYVRWTAPNQHSEALESDFGVEDLALWTEAPQTSQVKSGGSLDAKGVFFLPNARLETRSPASFTPRDAQFIARSLKLFQGTLEMQPTTENSIPYDVLASTSLVR